MKTFLPIFALFFLTFPGILSLTAADRGPAPISPTRLTPTVRAVNQALPWIVNIGTEKLTQVKDPFDLFFSKFFNPHYQLGTPVRQYYPLGSGVIIDESGLVATNFHVIQRASSVEVRLWDGSSYPAVVVGFDQPNDLCLLRMQKLPPERKLQAAVFARAHDLYLGETVITIGNPFGLEHSVSQGVLSATNRSLKENDIEFSDILQTDAAINPGNSGGPLINLDGELIGMNLAIREDAEGIGFAIPLARIELFLANWMLPCRYGNAWLGLDESAMTDAQYDGGLILPEPLPDSPLAVAGFRAGEVITAVNGNPVSRPIDLARATWRLQAGDAVEIALAGGKSRKVVVGALPDEMLPGLRLGLTLQPMTRTLAKAMGTPEELAGLVISEVIPQHVFSMQRRMWRDILKRGDVIVSINGKNMKEMKDLYAILRDLRSGQTVNMVVISFNPSRRTYRPISVDVILN